MYTDYSFLEPGAAWPPKNVLERARLKRYADNDALFVATRRYLGECGFEITYITEDLHA